MSSELNLSNDGYGTIIIENSKKKDTISLYVSLRDQSYSNSNKLLSKRVKDLKDGKSDINQFSKKIKVFIFVAGKDIEKSIVKRLIQDLKSIEAIELFTLYEDVLPGENEELRILKEMEKSDKCLVLFSSFITRRSDENKYIKEACKIQDKVPDGEIFIIPIKLEDVELPQELKRLKYYNLFQPHDYDKVFDRIILAITKDQEESVKRTPPKKP